MAKRHRKVLDAETKEKVAIDSREIGSRVSKLREHLGITSTELAAKVNLSQAQISRLENGLQGFRSHTIAKIAEALGVKPIYFFMENKKVKVEDVIQENEDVFGPGVTVDLKEAMKSTRFKRFALKSAELFNNGDASFSKLSILVRKTKV